MNIYKEKYKENGDNVKKRILSIDLLRILSMLLIVISHFFTHGLSIKNVDFPVSMIGIVEHLWCEMLNLFSSIAVNLYVLITGYFLIKEGIRYNKITHIWVQTVFYSLFFYFMFIFFGIWNFNINSFVKNILVIRYGAVSDFTYWFVAQYIGLVLLSPFLNKIANSLDANKYRVFIIILLLLDISIVGIGYGAVYSGGQSLFHFIVMYCIAGYIRIYGFLRSIKQKHIVILLLILLLLPCIGIQFSELYIHKAKVLEMHSIFNNYNGIPSFLATLFFVLFSRMKIQNKIYADFILKIAPYTFGVYLIHDNIYVRKWLWPFIMTKLNITDKNIILYSLLIPIILFLLCVLIDKLRKDFFNKVYVDDILDKIIDYSSRAMRISQHSSNNKKLK